jgi:hypothetical protein
MTVRVNYTRGQRPTVADMNTFAANPALQYIGQVNLNAVTTTIASGFSSTYDNYRLEFSNLRSTTANTLALLSFTGGTGTAHSSSYRVTSETGAVTLNNQTGSAYWLGLPLVTANVGSQYSVDFFAPYVSLNTQFSFRGSNGLGSAFGGGFLNNNNQYVGFSIVGLFSTTIQGTLRIYGYRKA